jgi:hypothetical protein
MVKCFSVIYEPLTPPCGREKGNNMVVLFNVGCKLSVCSYQCTAERKRPGREWAFTDN